MNMRKPILLLVLLLLALSPAAGAQDRKDDDKNSWIAAPRPPPPTPPTDVRDFRNEYDAKVKELQDATDAAAKKYQKPDGTVDTENPGYKKLQQDYVNQKTALRNQYNANHPSTKTWKILQNTPEGGQLTSSGSNPSSPHSDMDITAGTDDAAKAAADHLKGKGHKVTYDPELGMYQDHTSDTKIWEPETDARAKARATNPEGYTRSGSLEHEGIKSPNSQYDPEGYVEDLNKKYEAAKAKGDTRTMNKIAGKMQEATGKPVDPVTGKMKVDADPYESGEQNFGESEEIKNAKAQDRIKQLDETVKQARDTAKAQSESNKKMRDELAKKENELGNKQSAKEYEDANKKIEKTTPKSEPKPGEPGKTTSQPEPPASSTPEQPKPPSKPPEAGTPSSGKGEPGKPPAGTPEPGKPPTAPPETVKPPVTPPESVKPPVTPPEPGKPPATPPETVKPPTTPEPVKPPSTPEPGKPPATTEPVKPPQTGKPPSTPPETVKPPSTSEPVKPPTAPPEPVKPPTTPPETVKPPSMPPETVKPPSTPEPVKPPTTTEPVKPPATTEPVKPPTAPEPVKPPAAPPETVKPPPGPEPVKPPATTEPVKPPATTEPVKPPSTPPEPVKPPAAPPETVKPPTGPEPVKPPTAAEPVKPPAGGTGQTPPVETWKNPITGKELPVGTSGNRGVDAAGKALQNPKVQGGINVVGGYFVAKDTYETVGKVNEAAAKGDLKTANVEGSKGIGRLGGGWLGGIGGAKAGAALGTALGDGPGAVVGGFIGALVGGYYGSKAGEKTGEVVGPVVIDGVRNGGQKVMEKYYGVDGKEAGGGQGGTPPGGWENTGDSKGFDRIEKVIGDSNKDKGPSGPSAPGFMPPAPRTTSSGGSTLTPVPSGGSTYRPPSTPGGGIDISVPGQNIDEIDFGNPPGRPTGGTAAPPPKKPSVKQTPPPPPQKEPVKQPEPPKAPPVEKPKPPPPPPAPPPEETTPPGIEVVDKGWVKDGNGVIKVTETKDANGNVIKVTHTEYGADGKVIKTTDYPGGKGEGVTTVPGGDQDTIQQPPFGPTLDGNTGTEVTTPPAEGTTGQTPSPSGGDISIGGSGLGKPPDAANHSPAYNKLYELGWETERIMELKKIICPKNANAVGFHTPDKAEEEAWAPYEKRLEELGNQRDAILNDPNVMYSDKGAFGSGRFDYVKAVSAGRVKNEPFLPVAGTASNVTEAVGAATSTVGAAEAAVGGVQASVDELRTGEAVVALDAAESIDDMDRPLQTMIQERNTKMEKKTDNGMSVMGANTDLKNASNAGNDMLRDAKYVRDAGGQEAAAIAAAGQQAVRIEQDKNKSKILDAVVNGLGTGVKTTAGHLGTELGKGVGDKIFESGRKETKTASTDDSTPPAAEVPGGGGDHPSSGSSAGSHGTQITSDRQPSSGSGPACVSCGAPAYMEFEGVGWLCHDCESKGHDYPPGGTTAEPGTDDGTEPVIMADAICPICGQMYNPAAGHQCPGAVQAPTAGTEPPAAPPSGVICGHCGQRVPSVRSANRGMGYSLDDGSSGWYQASIENACDACIAKWEAQCDAESAKIQPKPKP